MPLDAQHASADDLLNMASFMDTPLCQSLATLHANDFFCASHSSSSSSSTSGHISMDTAASAPWSQLPRDWQDWILRQEVLPEQDKRRVLGQLARNSADQLPHDLPSSLLEYMSQCRDLALARDCPTSRFSFQHRTQPGMSQKKYHEVTALVAFIQSLYHDPPSKLPKRALDLGSGRAHLSRALALAPLNMAVTAVDSSDVQLSGANKLDTSYAKKKTDDQMVLEHRLQKLDSADDIRQLFEGWCHEHSSEEEEDEEEEAPLVLGLHACGDLSVSILKAFADNRAPASLILVSCCYNLLSADSLHLSGLAHPRLIYNHLTLSTQTPCMWDTTTTPPTTTTTTTGPSTAFLSSHRKLFYRARLEAEHACSQRRVGRIRDWAYTSYATYRAAALGKTGSTDPSSIPPPPAALRLDVDGLCDKEEEAEARLLFRFSCLWTVRALLGPVVESYILLDRHLFLKQQKGFGGPSAQLVPVFDQASGSLRNMAFVCK